MNKVLNFTDRLEDKKREKQLKTHHYKVKAIQRIVQCSSCPFRCAMCGFHVDAKDPTGPDDSNPTQNFVLCEDCRAEFEDFLQIKSGKMQSNIFWQNKEWMKLWSAWLDYHQAIGDFRNSREFNQLLDS